MHSLLIVSPDKKQRQTYIDTFCTEHAITAIDRTQIEKEEDAKSIGIDEVKKMQQKVFLKPIQSKTKAVILEDAHLLTNEAQNALLKTLEEPPDHTILFLSAEEKEAFLPTILSRCQIVELKTENKKLSEKKREEYGTFLESFPTMSIGERLKKAEQLAKDKEKAIEWTKNVIMLLREQMIQAYKQSTQSVIPASEQESKILNQVQDDNRDSRLQENDTTMMIRSFQTLHTKLRTTNVNARFAIENTLLSL